MGLRETKMRYLGAQWLPYLENDLWLENALHANAMAQKLAEVLARHPQVEFTQKVESNQIFCILPPETLNRLREKYFFYMWNDATGEARFVTSWDTTDEDIKEFESRLL